MKQLNKESWDSLLVYLLKEEEASKNDEGMNNRFNIAARKQLLDQMNQIMAMDFPDYIFHDIYGNAMLVWEEEEKNICLYCGMKKNLFIGEKT